MLRDSVPSEPAGRLGYDLADNLTPIRRHADTRCGTGALTRVEDHFFAARILQSRGHNRPDDRYQANNHRTARP